MVDYCKSQDRQVSDMNCKLWALLLALLLVLGGCGSAVAPTESTTLPAPVPTTEPAPRELVRILETDSALFSLSGCGDLCAVLLEDPDHQVSLVTLSADSGEQLGSVTVPEGYLDVMSFPGGVATWSWDNTALQVYSERLEPLYRREFPREHLGILQSDGCLYLFSSDSRLMRLNLADQTEQTVEFPDGLVPVDVPQCRDGKSLICCTPAEGSDMIYFWVDWSTGALQPTELPALNVYLSRTRFYHTIAGHGATYLRNPDADPIYRIPGASAWIIQSTQTRVLSEETGGVLAMADLETGIQVRRATSGVTNAALCGDRVVYEDLAEPGSLYLWDTSLAEPAPESVSMLTAAELAAENDRIAAALTEQTGMPVFFGEAGTNYNHNKGTSYVSDPVTDPLTVHLALEQLQILVGEYPDGIFREMCTEAFQPIEIYLTGAIRGWDYGSNPIGFTTYTGDAQIVVLDIGDLYDPDSLRATIAHEFMHVMENRINEHSLETGLNYLDYWMSFTPDPALYYFNYNDYLDYDRDPNAFTTYTDLPREEVLFLDPYSRTMPTEDRARILEFLYAGETSGYADALQTGILRQKAEYLCAVIRECFPSCQIDGKLPWETLVDVVPFSEYEEAVRSYQPQALG